MAKQGRRVVWRNQAETAAGDLLLLYFLHTVCKGRVESNSKQLHRWK